QPFTIFDRIDLGQQRFERLSSQLVERRHVHAGGVEIASQLRDAALRLVSFRSGFFQDGPYPLFVRLAVLPTSAPAVHRRGNWIVGAPSAIGILIKIRAGICLLIYVAELNTL